MLICFSWPFWKPRENPIRNTVQALQSLMHNQKTSKTYQNVVVGFFKTSKKHKQNKKQPAPPKGGKILMYSKTSKRHPGPLDAKERFRPRACTKEGRGSHVEPIHQWPPGASRSARSAEMEPVLATDHLRSLRKLLLWFCFVFFWGGRGGGYFFLFVCCFCWVLGVIVCGFVSLGLVVLWLLFWFSLCATNHLLRKLFLSLLPVSFAGLWFFVLVRRVCAFSSFWGCGCLLFVLLLVLVFSMGVFGCVLYVRVLVSKTVCHLVSEKLNCFCFCFGLWGFLVFVFVLVLCYDFLLFVFFFLVLVFYGCVEIMVLPFEENMVLFCLALLYALKMSFCSWSCGVFCFWVYFCIVYWCTVVMIL